VPVNLTSPYAALRAGLDCQPLTGLTPGQRYRLEQIRARCPDLSVCRAGNTLVAYLPPGDKPPYTEWVVRRDKLPDLLRRVREILGLDTG
jgi:hypothetical protein